MSRSAPVGLWQQPWSRTRSPASASPSASIIRSNSRVVLRLVVIGIGDHLDARRGDQRRVIGPGRLADEDPRASGSPARPARRRAGARRSRPGSAGRRSGRHPRHRRAEHDRPDQLDEAGVALRADIGLGLLALDQAPLGLLHAFQDRGVAGAVAEDADADVDLVRARDRHWRGRSARSADPAAAPRAGRTSSANRPP